MTFLHFAARHGRWCLVLGLVAGFALPGVAAALRPWLGELVALLLFLTAFRIGARDALGGLGAVPGSLARLAVLQLTLPLIAVATLGAFGLTTQPFALAAILMLSAPAVTGAPNFAIMNGHDPAPAMRLLVLGTALFPLTALPVLMLLPGIGGAAAALAATAKLIAVILFAVGAGFVTRMLTWPELSDDRRTALDGLAALVLAVVVVGLMAAIGPLVRSAPATLLAWALAVMALNLGLQVAGFLVSRRLGLGDVVSLSIIAGNRNIALFLVALPDQIMGPLLIFIGCYQIPMYLTPILMKPFHDRARIAPR